MIAESAALFEPAAAMPVSAEIRCLVRYDHNVPDAARDRGFTPWTCVCLHRLVRLDSVDDLIMIARKLLRERLWRNAVDG